MVYLWFSGSFLEDGAAIIIDRRQALHGAFGVAPFNGIPPSNLVYGFVARNTECFRLAEIIAVLCGKFLNFKPLTEAYRFNTREFRCAGIALAVLGDRRRRIALDFYFALRRAGLK